MIKNGIDLTGRALRFLSSEVRGLHAAAYVLAACALLSSLLALVRDRLLAHSFGASTTLDLYYAGFRIPDLIFVGTAALVSVYMLIPELARRNEGGQRDYIDTIVAGFSLFAVFVACTAALLAPSILGYLFPAFTGEHASQLVTVTRILLLQPILLGLSNILAAITQSRHRYALYALSPLLYNIGIIAGVAFLYPVWGIAGLAWGVVIGALFHAGIQIPAVVSDGFLRRIPRLREPRALLHTALVSVPRALALSMGQLTFLGLTALAGTLVSGSIAVFMFAYNLASVPLAIIGASYSVAAFPTLAEALSRGARVQFIEHVATAARYVFFWSIPISALILVLRAYVVRVILGSGAFDWTDTRLTAACFALFSLALAAQGLQLLLVRGYYAAGRTFMPFVISFGTMVATLGCAIGTLAILDNAGILHVVSALLRIEDVQGARVVALSFSYALASIVGAIVLAIHFEYRFGGFFAQVRRAFLESCAAALLGGAGAYVALSLFSPLFPSTETLPVFLLGFLGGVSGIIATALTYYLLGSREYKETLASVRARLWRRAEEEGVTLVTSAET
ncbi:MAG: lipid II flippase MurJ [Patescibacteria group bacterium]